MRGCVTLRRALQGYARQSNVTRFYGPRPAAQGWVLLGTVRQGVAIQCHKVSSLHRSAVLGRAGRRLAKHGDAALGKARQSNVTRFPMHRRASQGQGRAAPGAVLQGIVRQPIPMTQGFPGRAGQGVAR